MKRIISIGLGALILVGAIGLGSPSVAAKDRADNHTRQWKAHHQKHHRHHKSRHRHRSSEGWRKPSY